MNIQRNGRGYSCPPSGCHRMHTVGIPLERSETGRKYENGYTVKGAPLAMAYIPVQEWRNVLDPSKALCSGTVFADLVKPFSPCKQG